VTAIQTAREIFINPQTAYVTTLPMYDHLGATGKKTRTSPCNSIRLNLPLP
jgi:hypothetical protein